MKAPCVWEWGDYEECSVTCGGGTQDRFPVVIVPAQHGGHCPPDVVNGVPENRPCNLQECPTTPTTNTATIIAATIPSILVMFSILAVIGVILIYCKKVTKEKRFDLENFRVGAEEHIGQRRVSVLSSQLKEQLKNKRMMYCKDQLDLTSTVGQGESGLVYKGYLNTAVGKQLVAVKTGKALFSRSDIDRLAKEVSTMLSFEHTNVMSLVGVCTDGEMPLLIMPFMSNGSVLEFVRHHREELLCENATQPQIESTRKSLLNIFHQISKGMEYLAVQKFVHRDLAARNCMIDRNGVIKVADFGLTEDMYSTNYFRREKGETGSEEKVPIRWMAPESIENYIYTEASDVWAYAVTMWEIFTCGRVPYTGIHAMGLLKALQRGQRLEKPDNQACQDLVYEVMMECWSLRPHARPNFQSLVRRMDGLLERESGYLELSPPLRWKKSSPDPPSSPQPTLLTEKKTSEDEAEEGL